VHPANGAAHYPDLPPCCPRLVLCSLQGHHSCCMGWEPTTLPGPCSSNNAFVEIRESGLNGAAIQQYIHAQWWARVSSR